MYAMTPVWKPCLHTVMADKSLFGFPVFSILLPIHFRYLSFKFWNFAMKLFHLLGFTKELVFGSPTSVTRLNLSLCVFQIDLAFLRNQQEQSVTLLKQQRLHFIRVRNGKFSSYLPIKFYNRICSPFKNVLTFLSPCLKSANKDQ